MSCSITLQEAAARILADVHAVPIPGPDADVDISDGKAMQQWRKDGAPNRKPNVVTGGRLRLDDFAEDQDWGRFDEEAERIIQWHNGIYLRDNDGYNIKNDPHRHDANDLINTMRAMYQTLPADYGYHGSHFGHEAETLEAERKTDCCSADD